MGKKRKTADDGQTNSPKKGKKEKSEMVMTNKHTVNSSKDLLMKRFEKINVLGGDKTKTEKENDTLNTESKGNLENKSNSSKKKSKKAKTISEASYTIDSETSKGKVKSRDQAKLQQQDVDNDDEEVEDSAMMEDGENNDEEKLDPEKIAMRKKKREKRQQKKLEKEKRKQESAEKAGTAGPLAVEYLKQWDTDRDHWKFMKVRQVWLLQNMFDSSQIDDEVFKILLRYLEPLKGKSREASVEAAEKIMAEEAEKDDSDVNTVKQDRAKEIIQLLS